MIVQLVVTLFVLFAFSRVWLRYRDGSLGLFAATLWSAIWIGLGVVVWIPQVTDILAKKIGIGRGADALVYISIVGLVYGVFRLYIKMEFIEHELTSLVRALAIQDKNDQSKT